MSTEKIIHVLQNNGRTTCREIAKTAGLDCANTIRVLVELEQAGRVEQLNGYWWLSGAAAAPLRPTKRVRVRKSA